MQQSEWLKRGSEVQSYRRWVVKDGLKRGEISLPEIFDDPMCKTMLVFDVLRAVPQIGEGKASRLLVKVGIGHRTTCETMTARQRLALLAEAAKHRSLRMALESHRA